MSERRLKGRYELRAELGRGLATTTHLALDHETGERCVVKVLRLSAADALKAHELLTREAHVLQRLDHPRIPRLLDFFSEEDGADTRVCLVQQHVEGESLHDHVRGDGPLRERDALALGVELCQVLEYLHGFEPPILHRDVKPANVLLTAAGRAWLVDFGAVRDHLPHEMLHPSGPTIVGTRGFMPIEQFEGQAVPGSDLYALGATLVFALSGKEPAELGKEGMRLAFEPHVAVSPRFAKLLGRLLEPDWRERPLSAREVREELERLGQDAARPRAADRRRGLWRGPALLALSAAVALGIVLRRAPAPLPSPAGEGAPARPGFWQRLFGERTPRDAFGDPLPQDALRRVGTIRLRHGGPVRGVAFTPDGASVVSASEDGSVSVWSTASGEERRRMRTWEPATSLALSPDGTRLLVGTERFFTARLFGLDGREIARLLPAGPANGPTVAVSEVAFSPDGTRVATRMDESVDVWSGSDGRHRFRLPGCGRGRGLAFGGADRGLFVSCAGTARVVDAETGAELRRLDAVRHGRLPFAVSSDGRLLAVVDSRVELQELGGSPTRRSLADPELQASWPSAFCFSPDGRTAVAGLANGKVLVWDLATGARRLVIEAHAGAVTAVAVSRDGRLLASGAESGSVRLHDLATGSELPSVHPLHGAVRGIDFLPGTGALVAVADRTLHRFDRAFSQASLRSYDRPASAVFALSERRLAAVEVGRVHVHDVASGWEVATAPLPFRHGRLQVAVAPSRGLLAAGGGSTLDVVDLASGARRSFPVPRPEEALAFSPDGLVVATLRDEERALEGPLLVLRDAASGAELSSVPHHKGGAFPFACRSPDGSYFGFNAGLWRLASGRSTRPEQVAWLGRARLCAVSADVRFVALTTPDDPDVIQVRERVRDASGRHELRLLGERRGHRGPVASLVFAPDSRTLVSGGADSSILLWDVESFRSSAEEPPRPAPGREPRLRLSFEEGTFGVGVAPVRVAPGSPFALVPGRVGSALAPRATLSLPEGRGLVLGDEYTLTVFFRVDARGTGPGNHPVIGSELVTIDVRDGGQALVFLHFLMSGGHASVELTPWIGRVEADRWYHVGVSFRRDAGLTRVCVDGVCGPGPPGRSYADRVGELTLARAWQEPGVVTLDELAVYDRALADDEIARAAGLARAVPLPSPTPPPTPTPLPPLPAEAEPVPPEGRPEGRDVTRHVTVEQKTGFTVYRFGGPIARAQTLDLDLGQGAVWVGTSLGLLRHDPGTGSFRLWDESSGLPGERLHEIAVLDDRIVVDTARATKPGYAEGTGVWAYYLASRTFRPANGVSGAGDLWGDGSTLWVGSNGGAEAHDLVGGTLRRFTRAAGQLVHDSVSAVRRHGDTVAFAAAGDYVKETKDFTGGGLTLWNRRDGRFRHYTPREGLARGYCSDVFLDDDDVFVVHWDEERGLTRIDRRSGKVEAWPKSANGIELGGVVLAGDRGTLWVGQQGALVRLDRATRQATVLREADGMPGYIVSGIVVAEDAVWVSAYAYGQGGVSSAGLVRFRR